MFLMSTSFIAISVILTTIVVATIVGNLFVILAILMDKNLQTNANQLVLSLAVADLMVACLVMPLGAYNDIYQGWYLSKEVCEFWTSADVLCCTASILNLLAIALDRYWAVTNVDYIYKRTRRRVNMMILCAWTVGAIVSLAPIFGWKDPDFASRVLIEHKCMVSQDVAYQIFATISTFYAPLVLLLALYWRIFQVARKRIRRKPGQQQRQLQPHNHHNQPKQVLPKGHPKDEKQLQLQLQLQQQQQQQQQRPQPLGNQTPLSLLSATVTSSNTNNRVFSFEIEQLKEEEKGKVRGEAEEVELKEQLLEEVSVNRRKQPKENSLNRDYDGRPQTEIVNLSSQSCCKSSALSTTNVVDLEKTINSIPQISSPAKSSLVFGDKGNVGSNSSTTNESSCAKTIVSICAPAFVHNKRFKKAKIGPKELEEDGDERNSGNFSENDTQKESEPAKQYDKLENNCRGDSLLVTKGNSGVISVLGSERKRLERRFNNCSQFLCNRMKGGGYKLCSNDDKPTGSMTQISSSNLTAPESEGFNIKREKPSNRERVISKEDDASEVDRSGKTLVGSSLADCSKFRLQRQKRQEQKASIYEVGEKGSERKEGEGKSILIQCEKAAKVGGELGKVTREDEKKEKEANDSSPSNDLEPVAEVKGGVEHKIVEGKNRNRLQAPVSSKRDTFSPSQLPDSSLANLHCEERNCSVSKGSIVCKRAAAAASVVDDHKCFKVNKSCLVDIGGSKEEDPGKRNNRDRDRGSDSDNNNNNNSDDQSNDNQAKRTSYFSSSMELPKRRLSSCSAYKNEAEKVDDNQSNELEEGLEREGMREKKVDEEGEEEVGGKEREIGGEISLAESSCDNQIGRTTHNWRRQKRLCWEQRGHAMSLLDETDRDELETQSKAGLKLVASEQRALAGNRRMNGQLLSPEGAQSSDLGEQQVVGGRREIKRTTTTANTSFDINSNCSSYCCCNCDTCLALPPPSPSPPTQPPTQTYCPDCDSSSEACIPSSTRQAWVEEKRAQINHRINCRAYLKDDEEKCCCSGGGGGNMQRVGRNENKRDKKGGLASQCQGVQTTVLPTALRKLAEEVAQSASRGGHSNIASAHETAPKVPDLMEEENQKLERHLTAWAGKSRERGLKIDQLYKNTTPSFRQQQQLERVDNMRYNIASGFQKTATSDSSCSRHPQKQVMLSNNNATCTQTKLESSSASASPSPSSSSLSSSSPSSGSSSPSLKHKLEHHHHHHKQASNNMELAKRDTTKATTSTRSSPSNCSFEYMIESADVDGRKGGVVAECRGRQDRCGCSLLECTVDYELDHGDATSNNASTIQTRDAEDDYEQDYDDDVVATAYNDGAGEEDDDDDDQEFEEDEDEPSLSASFPPPFELCVSRLKKTQRLARVVPSATARRDPAERDRRESSNPEEAAISKQVPLVSSLAQASTSKRTSGDPSSSKSNVAAAVVTHVKSETRPNLNQNSKLHLAKLCAHSIDDKSSLLSSSLFVSSSEAQQQSALETPAVNTCTTNTNNTATTTKSTRTNALVTQQHRPQNKLQTDKQVAGEMSHNGPHFPFQASPAGTLSGSKAAVVEAQRNNISRKRHRLTTSTTLDLRQKFRTMGQLVSFVQTSKNFYSTTTSGEGSSSNQSSQSSAASASHLASQGNNNNKSSFVDLEQQQQQQPQTRDNIGRLMNRGASFCEQVSFRLKRRCNLTFGGTGTSASGGASRGVAQSALPSVSASVTSANMGGNLSGSSTCQLEKQEANQMTTYNNEPTTTTTTESKMNTATNNTGNNKTNINKNTNNNSDAHQRIVVQASKRSRENMDIRREKKAAKTLAIITGVFVCCWLPFFLNAIIMPICGPSCTPNDLILSVLLWLGYLNSLLNPIIYTIFSPDFRRAFRRLLCWPELVRLTGSTFKTTSGKA